MTDDETQIRAADRAVGGSAHRGDLDAVLAISRGRHRHVRRATTGERRTRIDAYRETWPPFFEFQAQGAAFEILSRSHAMGDDVAYAYVLRGAAP